MIVDRNNTLMTSAAQLAELMYPEVMVRCQLEGTQSLVDWHRALDVVNFEAKFTAVALFE